MRSPNINPWINSGAAHLALPASKAEVVAEKTCETSRIDDRPKSAMQALPEDVIRMLNYGKVIVQIVVS
jgi:hypothetical protein